MAAAVLFAGLTTAPARAQTDVDLQLVLAVDASGSVSMQRFELQQQGYAAAFRDPRVLKAIRSGAAGAIAVTMFQWTGPTLHVPVVPWMLIKDEPSAHAVANAIEKTRRELFGGGTSISGAIDFAMKLLPQSQFRPARRVIDISGDGANTSGRPVDNARDEAVRAGVVINGLPILALDFTLDRYFFNHVIGGPGSFVIGAASYEHFAEAIVKKLIMEIAGPGAPETPTAPMVSSPILIGSAPANATKLDRCWWPRVGFSFKRLARSAEGRRMVRAV
jgi:hypothetical protein